MCSEVKEKQVVEFKGYKFISVLQWKTKPKFLHTQWHKIGNSGLALMVTD